MIGWIKNVIGTILPQAIGQGASAIAKKGRLKVDEEEGGEGGESEAALQETREKSSKFLGAVTKTGQPLDNLKLRINVRRKVKKNLAPFYDLDDIPEEITEKLVEAAQSDPFFKKWFR